MKGSVSELLSERMREEIPVTEIDAQITYTAMMMNIFLNLES